MLTLIGILKEQVQNRMNTVPSTLYEYYNGKLDMLLELETIVNTIELEKFVNETGKANGFKTND